MADVSVKEKSLAEKFLGGKVRIFESGKERPYKIQDRHFFALASNQGTSFLANTKGAIKAGDYTLSKEPCEEQDSAMFTESHDFISQMEGRFKMIDPNATLIIIDPDVVMGRYAADDSKERSVEREILLYIKEKLQEIGRVSEIEGIDMGYAAMIKEAAFDDNSPFSQSNVLDRSPWVPEGQSQVSIVVASNPDQPMHSLWTGVPGSKERGVKIGLTDDHARRIILYHEIFHALDPEARLDYDAITFPEFMLRRHRTECGADAHALLQAARDFGNTDAGELFSDIRSNHTLSAIERVFPAIDPENKQANPLDNMMKIIAKITKEEMKKNPSQSPRVVLNKLMKNLRKGNYDHILKAAAEGKAFDDKFPLAGEEIRSAFAEAKSEPEKKGPASEAVTNLYETSNIFKVLSDTMMSLAYRTSPTADATIAYAKEALKDGSLMKMTDAEVYAKAEEIRNKTALNEERLCTFAISVLQGQVTPELVDCVKREKKSQGNMKKVAGKNAIDEAYAEKMAFAKEAKLLAELKKNGVNIPAPRSAGLHPDMIRNILEWRGKVLETIVKEGGNRDALLKVVKEEKDSLREFTDPAANIKIAILNHEFLSDPRDSTMLAVAQASMNQQIGKIKPLTKEASSVDLLCEFIQEKINQLSAVQKGTSQVADRMNKVLDVNALKKSVTIEGKAYQEVIASEAKIQALSSLITSDKKASWMTVTAPALNDAVFNASAKKHPEFLDQYMINTNSPEPWRIENVQYIATENKKDIVASVLTSKSLLMKITQEKPEFLAYLKTVAAEKDSPMVDKKRQKIADDRLRNAGNRR